MFRPVSNWKFYITVLLTVMLSGCGKILTRPEVSVNVPLAPSVLYVPSCGVTGIESKSSTASEDVLWEAQVCKRLWQALESRLNKKSEKYRLVHLHEATPFVGDVTLEKAIGARYRVIIGQPTKYLHRAFGVVPIRILDIKTNKLLVSVAITIRGQGVNGAEVFANKLVSGLNGPRCKTEPLFAFININGMASDVDGCKTFRLPATH